MGLHTRRRRRSSTWATTAATAVAVAVGAQQGSAQHQAATPDAHVRPPAIPASAVPLEALSILRYFREIERRLLFMSPQEVDQAPLVVQELSECLDSLSMNHQSVSALVTLDRTPAAKGVRQSPLQAVLDVATLSHASWGVDALWALAPSHDDTHHSRSTGARTRAAELSWRDPTPECVRALHTATHTYRSGQDQGAMGRFWAWEDRPRNLTCMAHTEGEVGMALCTDATPLPARPPPPPPATTVQRKIKSLLGRTGMKGGQSQASGLHNGHDEAPTLVQTGLLMNVGSTPMCHATLQVHDLGDASELLHGRRPEVVSEVEYHGFMGAGAAVRYNVPAGGQVKLGGNYGMSLLTEWRACTDDEILAANVTTTTTHAADTHPHAPNPPHAHTHNPAHADTHTPIHGDTHAPQRTPPFPPASSSTPTTHTRTRPSILQHGHNLTPSLVGGDNGSDDDNTERGEQEVDIIADRVVHDYEAVDGPPPPASRRPRMSPSAPSPSSSSSSSAPTRGAVEGGMPQASLPSVRWLEGGDHFPFATLFNEAGDSVVLQAGEGVRDSDPHPHATIHTPDTHTHTSDVHVGLDTSGLLGEGGGVQARALLQEVMRALPVQMRAVGGVAGLGQGGSVVVDEDVGEVVRRAMEHLEAIRSAHQRVVDGIQAQFLTLAFDSHSQGAPHAPLRGEDRHVDTETRALTEAHAVTHTVAQTSTHADTHAHAHAQAHHVIGDNSHVQVAAGKQAKGVVYDGTACGGGGESMCVSELESYRREPGVVRAPARRPEVTRMHTRSGKDTHTRTHAHAHAHTHTHRESEAPAAAPTPRAVGRGKAEGQQVDERLRNLQHNPHQRPPRWPGLWTPAQDDAPLNQSSQQHEDGSSDGVPPPQPSSRAEKLEGNVVLVKGRRLLVE